MLAAALVGLWLCWGSSFPAMRVMVATLPPLLASGAIFTTAGLVLAVACRPRLRDLRRRQVVTTAGTGLCLLGAQGVVAVAVQHVYASTAALLVAAIPLWVAVLRLVLGDRPGSPALLRLALGFAGVALVLIATSTTTDPADPTASQGTGWALLIALAAISWAAGTLWASRSASLVTDTGAATTIQLLTGGVVLLLAGLLVGEAARVAPEAISASSWTAFAYLVLFDSLAGFALFHWLLRTTPVSLVSTYAYAVPVVAYLIGVLVLGEPFHPWVLLGAAAILLAVATEVRAAPSTS